MNVKDAIVSRRSVKQFDPDHRMSSDECNKIMSLAMLSPTAFNVQHWRFLIVDDVELRKKVKDAAWGQTQVTDCSLLIILCADLKAWDKEPQRYWAHAEQEVQDFLLPKMDEYYRGKDQIQRDEVIRSCGIAAQTLMLAAKGMGYDSCPMDGFDFEKVAELIQLPDDHIITMFVAIGKATDEAHPRGSRLEMDEVVIRNTF